MAKQQGGGGKQAGGSAGGQKKKPNILVIWGDDIGITNLSCYSDGLMGYRTPNIDRLAKEGMRFTDSCRPAMKFAAVIVRTASVAMAGGQPLDHEREPGTTSSCPSSVEGRASPGSVHVGGASGALVFLSTSVVAPGGVISSEMSRGSAGRRIGDSPVF